jgi:hypothetical protein
MPTPGSWPTAYATGEDFTRRFDFRTANQLLSDNNAPLYPLVDPDTARLLVEADPTLNTFLQEASGMVEAACTRAGIYQIDPQAIPPRNDLADLLADTNSAQFLRGLVCGIAMWLLWERRPQRIKEMELPARAATAIAQLDDLADGKKVFGWRENQLEANTAITIDQPEDVIRRNGTTWQARRLYGRRANQSRRPGM